MVAIGAGLAILTAVGALLLGCALAESTAIYAFVVALILAAKV